MCIEANVAKREELPNTYPEAQLQLDATHSAEPIENIFKSDH
jgi:hypothetical protein